MNRYLFPALLSAAFLSPLASGPASADQIEDVRIRFVGNNTQCVKRAWRYWLTWQNYNEKRNELIRSGDGTIDAERMRWEADHEERVGWRFYKERPGVISTNAGDVTGDRNTRFGAIPNNADISVSYLFDWQVNGEYSWAASHQPRVESITELVIEDGWKAEIRFENPIMISAQGFISGTSNVANPWPQVASHDVQLLAVDIEGVQHQMNINRAATATPSHTVTDSNGVIVERSWSVSAGAGMSMEGPSVSAGVTQGGSRGTSTTHTTGTAVHTVPEVRIDELFQHTTVVPKTTICGEWVRVGRGAQINGNFLTTSQATHGRVSTSGTYNVTNTLTIYVECKPCPEGEDNRTPPRESEQTSTPSTTHDEAGVYFFPVEDGQESPPTAPRCWTCGDALGELYLDRRDLPPFLTETTSENIDLVPEDIHPLLVTPDLADATHLKAALISGSPVFIPMGNSPARVLPGLSRVEFDGPFIIADPKTEEQLQFGSGYVDFSDKSEIRILGDYTIVSPTKRELHVEEVGGFQAHQLYREFNGGALLVGQVAVDQAEAGTLSFDWSYQTNHDRTLSEIMAAPTPTPVVSVANGKATAIVEGSVTTTYQLQASRDLDNWVPATTKYLAPGTFATSVPTAETPQLFFRALSEGTHRELTKGAYLEGFPQGPLGDPFPTFQWMPVPGDPDYLIEIGVYQSPNPNQPMDPRGGILQPIAGMGFLTFEAGSDNSFAWPLSAPFLEPDQIYGWRVSAKTGKRTLRSPIYPFSLPRD